MTYVYRTDEERRTAEERRATGPVQVLPASQEWAYVDLDADYKAGLSTWREVSEDFYWQALEVLPPIYAPGGFLVGEAHDHETSGHANYAGFVCTGSPGEYGSRYFARYCTVKEFPARVAELRTELRRIIETQEQDGSGNNAAPGSAEATA